MLAIIATNFFGDYNKTDLCVCVYILMHATKVQGLPSATGKQSLHFMRLLIENNLARRMCCDNERAIYAQRETVQLGQS